MLNLLDLDSIMNFIIKTVAKKGITNSLQKMQIQSSRNGLNFIPRFGNAAAHFISHVITFRWKCFDIAEEYIWTYIHLVQKVKKKKGELTGSWTQSRLRVRDRNKRGISDTRRSDMRWDVSDMRRHLTDSANTKARAVLEKITSDRYKSLALLRTTQCSFQQLDEGNIKPWGLQVVTWLSSHFPSDWD